MAANVSDLASWNRTFPLVFNFLTWATPDFPKVADLYSLSKHILSWELKNAHNILDMEQNQRKPRYERLEMGATPINLEDFIEIVVFGKTRVLMAATKDEAVKVAEKPVKRPLSAAGVLADELISAPASLDSVEAKLDLQKKAIDDLNRTMGQIADATTSRLEAGGVRPGKQEFKGTTKGPTPARVSFNDRSEIPAGIGAQAGSRSAGGMSRGSGTPEGGGGRRSPARSRPSARPAGFPENACFDYALNPEGCTYKARTGKDCKYDHVRVESEADLRTLLVSANLANSVKVLVGKVSRDYAKNLLDTDPALEPFSESLLEGYEQGGSQASDGDDSDSN